MIQQNKRALAESLLSFIDRSPTAWQAAANLQAHLIENGFSRYDHGTELKPGDRRFVVNGGTAVFAFVIGDKPLQHGFRMVGAHNDAPALVVKPNSVMVGEGCIRLNTEVYGGPILNTWFDRPLSLAGRVVLSGEDPLNPETRLVNLQKPLVVIPNAAIHMNRTVNEGSKIEPQKMLLPVLGLAGPDPDNLLEKILADALAVDRQSIVDYDLFLYENTPGTILGLQDELILAPRLDNLGLSYAAVVSLAASVPQVGISLAACFDHEEVGSHTRQGAHSMYLRDLLEQIVLSLGGSRLDFLGSLDRSFLISADQAHAVHPNFSEYADATNKPRINGGPVIKRAANRSYTSDADTIAVFKALCRQADVPCQTFVNRSDLRGGSTIGPIFSQNLPVRAVDVGNPIWAMHSIRETGGVDDHAAMLAVLTSFFT
ncbi:MAG: M18 family aminopeptidase [Bacillota bacterium]|nr:M18 family aminopeptidase [Bacillota bacterium]